MGEKAKNRGVGGGATPRERLYGPGPRKVNADFSIAGSPVDRGSPGIEYTERGGQQVPAPKRVPIQIDADVSTGASKPGWSETPDQRAARIARIQSKIQPTQEAPVPMSIAPTPGDKTGNAPAPMQDAGRGGALVKSFSGELARRRGAAAGSEPVKGVDVRVINEPTKGLLPYGVQTSGPNQGPSRAPVQGPAPRVGPRNDQQREDMVRNIGSRIKGEFTNAKTGKRNRRIAYGAGGGLAALGTILNLRDNEEEQY